MSAASSDTTPAGGTPPATGPTTSPRAGQALNPIKRFLTLKEGSIVVVTVVTLIFFAVSTKHFLTGDSAKNSIQYFAPYAIMAAGEVWVMINGEIDLSVGGTYLISPFLFHSFHDGGIPLVLAMLLSILVCSAVGLINGIFVAIIKVNSFVATLGSLFTMYGVTLVISHNQQITTPGTSVLGGGTFANIFGGSTYSSLWWAIGIVIILQIALSFTKWGIYTTAVGGNRLGAQEAGINAQTNLIRNFILCATLAGFVGILTAVNAASATPDSSAAGEVLFQVVAVAVIGGTLLTGGFGTVVGAFIGALFLGVVQEGLDIRGTNTSYLELYLGIAILIAMSINVFIARVRVGSGRG